MRIKGKKIAIYTAMFGDYDDVKDPEYKEDGVDYICFTDNLEMKSDIYKIIIQKSKFQDVTRDARMRKILSHVFLSDYDYTIWVDSSIKVNKFDVKEYIEKALQNEDIAVFPHSARECVYDEAKMCEHYKKDDVKTMKSQMKRYINQGYPKKFGLVETGVLVRNNQSDAIIELNNAWWKEIGHGSKRDQLSFNYIVWKLNLKYKELPGNVRNSKFFELYYHSGKMADINELLKKKDKWIQHLEGDIKFLNREIERLQQKPVNRLIRKTAETMKSKLIQAKHD